MLKGMPGFAVRESYRTVSTSRKRKKERPAEVKAYHNIPHFVNDSFDDIPIAYSNAG